jgi:hypothetical protein
MKTDLGRSEKAKAIVHLVIVALVLIGLVVCGVRVFSGSGKERSRKHDRHAWNDSYKDHRERERNWPSVFGDLQETQLQAAIKNGVRGTVTRENVETLGMVQIGTNDLYKVDRLTHSVPWVVPKMATLLDDIGRAFQDSLYRRGYNRHHRIIVTSVTRTAEDVKRLSQQNVNATENSCHCYGTTIDITYVRYDKPEEHAASDEKLRSLLMQTVYDLREQKRCYVKFERKQSCLHITVR